VPKGATVQEVGQGTHNTSRPPVPLLLSDVVSLLPSHAPRRQIGSIHEHRRAVCWSCPNGPTWDRRNKGRQAPSVTARGLPRQGQVPRDPPWKPKEQREVNGHVNFNSHVKIKVKVKSECPLPSRQGPRRSRTACRRGGRRDCYTDQVRSGCRLNSYGAVTQSPQRSGHALVCSHLRSSIPRRG
jgi:hypothetical protein